MKPIDLTELKKLLAKRSMVNQWLEADLIEFFDKIKATPLSTEEIDYILTFMDNSAGYCKSDDDYQFDEDVKKKLEQMKLLVTGGA